MALNAKTAPGATTEVPVLEPATYPGRLLSVIDLGLQEQSAYMGKEKPPIHKILLSYELSDEFMPDEDGDDDPSKPRVLSEQIPLHNLSADLATSTKRYKALDPKLEQEGDFTALIGTPVNITIVANVSKSNGRTYNNVAGLAPMREKERAKLPDLVNPPMVFDLDEPDMEVFNKLYKWIQDVIIKNLEFNGSKLEALLEEDPDYKGAEDRAAPAPDEVPDDSEPDLPFE